MCVFPVLQDQKLVLTSEYASQCAKLAFGKSFWEIQSKQKELNMFVTSFNVKTDRVSENLQP